MAVEEEKGEDKLWRFFPSGAECLLICMVQKSLGNVSLLIRRSGFDPHSFLPLPSKLEDKENEWKGRPISKC